MEPASTPKDRRSPELVEVSAPSPMDQWTGKGIDGQAQEGDQHGGPGMPAFLRQDAAKREEI